MQYKLLKKVRNKILSLTKKLIINVEEIIYLKLLSITLKFLNFLRSILSSGNSSPEGEKVTIKILIFLQGITLFLTFFPIIDSSLPTIH